jgi:hydroxymethylpyrimidine/phosphomethylpyrimidine kinase
MAVGDAEGGLTRRTPAVLTIAGSDSGAGAGVQADLKTFAALGVYGTSALTAVTAQNTLGVRAIHTLPAGIVTAQLDAIFEDFNVAAVKIGMLPSLEIVEAIAEALVRFSPRFVVFDPVMVASSGDPLIAPAAATAMKSRLFSCVDCLTPNLSEAAAFLGATLARDEAEMASQARALLKFGPRAVLMKGGHLESTQAVDVLVTDTRTRRYAGPRIASRNLHGTGCTLSAAISAYAVLGRELEEAVADAKIFVKAAIDAGRDIELGTGSGPLMHLPLET